MSTFKRLFNVGKGKAKVAQREAAESDWVDVARHKAADAAEAVADVIRPPERRDADAIDEELRAKTTSRPVREPSSEPDVEDAEEVAAGIENAAGGPKPRTL